MNLPEYRNEPFIDFTKEENVKKLQDAFAKLETDFGRFYPMIIDGEEVKRDKTFKSYNPNNINEVIGEFPVGTKEDVDRAVEAAEKAFSIWRKTDYVDRAAISLRIANVFRKYRYELIALLGLEVGKSWFEADAEVAEGIDHFEYVAREIQKYAQGKKLTPFAIELNEYKYIPIGVGAVISPWNFPIGISTGMISAALVTGNAVVWKPSSDSPAISHFIMRILEEAKVPKGLVNLVYGSGSVVGNYLAEHPRIKFVGFTGSKEVGQKISVQAATLQEGQNWFKRTILELGGKNAIIVDSETNLEEAVDGVLYGAFGYQGQKCSACSRAIVVEEIYDDFVELITEKAKDLKVGPPKEQYDFGAVINESALNKIKSYIEIGKQEADLLVGGNVIEGDAYSLEPTIFANVDRHARIAQEEIFGPVLTIIKAKDFDDAIDIANGTIYGLSGAVYTFNPHKLAKAKEEFYVGNLYLNRRNTGAWIGAHPFGGYNMSGTNSKLGGPDYLLNYLQSKTISQKIILD